jgi:hypothetical protein
MRIAMVSAWDKTMQGVADVTLANRQAYCERHGYGCIFSGNWEGKQHPIWARIKLAMDHLYEWDWLCVADIDLIIMNGGVKIEEVLGLPSIPQSIDLVCSYDINGLNAGILFLKNTQWVAKFLGGLWSRSLDNPATMWEQTCIACMLYREPKDKWVCLPQRWFNSYLYELYGAMPGDYFPNGQYCPGDFVLHLPGVSNEKRIEVLGDYLKRAT